MTRAFVPDPNDKRHWTFADAGSGTDHVYLLAGFDTAAQTMTVEVNGVMYEWNAGGYLLATDVSRRKWTPFSFSFPTQSSNSQMFSIQLEPKQYSQADLVAEIQSALDSNPSGTLTSTYDVSYDLTGSYVQFKLLGGGTQPPDLSGDWQFTNDGSTFSNYVFTLVPGSNGLQYTYGAGLPTLEILAGYNNAPPNPTFTLRAMSTNAKSYVWNNSLQQAIETQQGVKFWRRPPSHGPQAFPGAAGESARILTDTELRERSYHPPYIDLSGSDWQ